jgi:hypothetical protein
MKTKLLLIAGLALANTAPLACAQEEWGEHRGEYMHKLRMDCESGDERACERLRHMRHEERRSEEDRDERGRDAPPPVGDPKVALCAAIETNYNNCIREQSGPGRHEGCGAWVIQLKANHCF